MVTNVFAADQHLFVTPSGSDKQAGTRDEPLATLQGAQRRVRELRRASPATSIQVNIAAGDYYLAKPLEFTAEDSGTKQAPILYTAMPGAKVRLIGGRAINDFQLIQEQTVLNRLTPAAQQGVLVANLKDQGITDYGELMARGHEHEVHPAGLELFYRGVPAQLARWPNKEWAKVEEVSNHAGSSHCRYSGAQPHRWQQARDAWAHGFWQADWSDAWQPVTMSDAASGKFHIDRTADVPQVQVGARFCFMNVLEELDQPGEWYLERSTGQLYFWPPEALQPHDVVISLLEHPVSFYDVSHVTLHGLTIEAARVCLVEVVRGEHVTFRACTFQSAGNYAAHIFGGKQHGIVDCTVSQTGEGGLRVEGGDRLTLTPCRHVVANNEIHHFARTCLAWRPAVSVHGVGIRITNNHIHHGPDGAITLSGNDHLVERNEIDHVCLETADVGAIYLGHDWTERGNIIRHNYLHHLGEFNRRDVMGVYLDDFASGTLVQGNLFVEAGRGVVIGGGRDNIVENNLFVDCIAGVQADARGLTWAKDYVTGEQAPLLQRLAATPVTSEVYRARYPALANLLSRNPALPQGNRIERNIFTGNITIDLQDPTTEELVAVRDNWSGRDPQFVDAAQGDYRLKQDSPALKTGFQPIPYGEIGRHPSGDAERVAIDNR